MLLCHRHVSVLDCHKNLLQNIAHSTSRVYGHGAFSEKMMITQCYTRTNRAATKSKQQPNIDDLSMNESGGAGWFIVSMIKHQRKDDDNKQ